MLLGYIFGWIFIVYSALFFCLKLDLYAFVLKVVVPMVVDFFYWLLGSYLSRFENVHCFYHIRGCAGTGYWFIWSIKVWKCALLLPHMWLCGYRVLFYLICQGLKMCIAYTKFEAALVLGTGGSQVLPKNLHNLQIFRPHYFHCFPFFFKNIRSSNVQRSHFV
jgi:hypothetical protein